MDDDTKILILGMLMAILIYLYVCQENYESKREKANTIANYFNNTSSHSYKDYRDKVPESDIVEYNDAKDLYTAGNMSVDILENKL